LRFAAPTSLVLALAACAPATPADRTDWGADFEQLLDHVAAVYANLEWAVGERAIDVHALAEESRSQLANAGSARAARKIVEEFVRAFDDPHFYVRRGDPGNGGEADRGASGLDPAIDVSDALGAMGFKKRDLDFRIDFEALPGFERVRPSPANPFVWAEFDAGDRRIGLVRIAHFGEDGYPSVAAPLWPAFAAELDEPCDGWCQWRFRERVMDRLLAYLGEGARALRDRGVDAMLIDISGNGGGTDWAAVAPRIFAPPLKHCPPIGVVRHPHHVSRLEHRLEHVQSLLEQPQIGEESRRTLERAGDAVAEQLAQARQPCDRRALFDEPDATLQCSQLTFAPGCGVLEYLPADALPEVDQRASIFRALGSDFAAAVWRGPLYVVTDRNTASASEQFVALLEANAAAVLLGEPTLGAGCGFIGGGVPLYMPHLDLTIKMPDCARYRANGRNEIEGIEPDVAIPWDGGDRARARRIHAALVQEERGP